MRGGRSALTLGALLLAVGFVRTTAQTAPVPAAAPAESTLSGVYTAAQAARGEETYMNICVGCHSAGTYVGKEFLEKWGGGRPLSDLFELMSEKMPKDDPGSLELAEYAQVVAYLLKKNNLPEGKTELSADVDVLKKIKFETPKAGPPQARGTRRWR
jgi:mono/diheme cytochrome c family protein